MVHLKSKPIILSPAKWIAADTALTLCAFVVLFVIQRLVFMAVYGGGADCTFGQAMQAIWAGLPMDFSTAGYLTILPLISDMVCLWLPGVWRRRFLYGYWGLCALLLALIFVADTALYAYWDFRLDITPLFYFSTSPSAAMASVTFWQMAGGLLAILLTAALIFAVLYLAGRVFQPKAALPRPWRATLVGLLLCALMVVIIRGSVTVSTMNPSRVYFSDNQRLNHIALNPAFSLLYSAMHQENFGEQFRYFDRNKLQSRLTGLNSTGKDGLAAADTVSLNSRCPDVYIIILESFSNHLFASLGGEDVATRLDSIARSGVVWTNFYASGFRTDRGIPAILSGFPSPPTTTVMKHVNKAAHLPSLAAELHRQAGYSTAYYYGGDANFTNMQAYLRSGGFTQLVSDRDFAIADKASKWGAHDDVLLQRTLANVRMLGHDAPPQITVIQTSSSHEPFEVPYSNPRFATNSKANAFAFTDSVVADFVNAVQATTRGRNALFVIVPDHWGAYPDHQSLPDIFARHRVPLILAGGALGQSGMRIDTPGSQTDIPATVLQLLGLDASMFAFSNNLLDPNGPHYAWMADHDEIAIICPEGRASYNIVADRNVISETEPGLTDLAKAYLQNLYDTLQKL